MSRRIDATKSGTSPRRWAASIERSRPARTATSIVWSSQRRRALPRGARPQMCDFSQRLQPPTEDEREQERKSREGRADEEGGARGPRDRRFDRADQPVAGRRKGGIVARPVRIERLGEIRRL